MQPRTVFKIIGAFLAGVLLALGAAIVHSRHSVVASVAEPAAASTRPPVKVAGNDRVMGEEPAPEENAKPALPGRVQTPTSSSPVRKNKPAPVERNKSVQLSARVGDMHPHPAVSQAVTDGTRNPWSVPVPPPPPDSVQSPARTSPPPQTATRRPEPHVVTLPAGTTLSVRLGESITSEQNKEGDTFQATLDAPVVSDGFIIAERRSRVTGRVVQANRAGRVKGLANLALAVTEINTTDGQRIPVETDSYEKWGNSSGKSDAAKVAGGAALGAIIGAIAGGGKGAAIGAGAGGAAGTGVALGTRGAAVSVPSESLLTFRLARPITITEKFN